MKFVIEAVHHYTGVLCGNVYNLKIFVPLCLLGRFSGFLIVFANSCYKSCQCVTGLLSSVFLQPILLPLFCCLLATLLPFNFTKFRTEYLKTVHVTF